MSSKKLLESLLFKAKKDVETAEDLFKLKHFDWCLFIWHLAIEKVLKARLLSLGKEIIYTHDLRRLAKEAEISFTKEQLEQLDEITTFNLEARYDDYKLSFYKKADEVYTKRWVKICKELYDLILNSI